MEDLINRKREEFNGTAKAELKKQRRQALLWAIAGMAVAILLVMSLFHGPVLSLQFGALVWAVDLTLVLLLTSNAIGARAGVFLSGVLLALPCFVIAVPMLLGLLLGGMFFAYLAAGALASTAPLATVRERMGFLCSWGGTHPAKRCARHFDGASFWQFVLATGLLALALGVLRAGAAERLGIWARWLAGGVMLLAFAEMISAVQPLTGSVCGAVLPPVMRSPWEARSIGDFWLRRWNLFASQKLFQPFCFAPLARRNPWLGVWLTFVVSGVGHALLAFILLGRWGVSIACGAFFVVQPLFMGIERSLGVKRWQSVGSASVDARGTGNHLAVVRGTSVASVGRKLGNIFSFRSDSDGFRGCPNVERSDLRGGGDRKHASGSPLNRRTN